MNRFKELIDDLSKRSDVLVKEIAPERDDTPPAPAKEPHWRLPYSSDPVPFGKPWIDAKELNPHLAAGWERGRAYSDKYTRKCLKT
jgi:hypothetical protein